MEKKQPIIGYILLGLIIFTTVLTLVKPIIRLPHQVFIDYNEGAVAFFSEYAVKKEPLYRSLNSFIINGYPPIYFYLTGIVGTLVGDIIIAGRGIALLGFLLAAAMIFYFIFRYSGSTYLAITGGLVFIGYMTIYHCDYVGMNDPQWLAHGFMLSGFALLVFKKKNRVLFYCSILIMLLAGLIKHNLIPVPVTLTVWLYMKDRKHFYRWIGVGFCFIIIAFVMMYFKYGNDFFTNILMASRTYRIGRIARIGIWLMPSIIYISAALMLYITYFKNNNVQLLLLYSVISLAWGAFTVGGGGVYYNAIFDFIISVFIAAFIAVGQLSRIVKIKAVSRRYIKISAVFILFFPLLFAVPSELYFTKEFMKNFHKIERQTKEDIAFVAAHPEPVMCENIALCYWAGKEFSFDFYTTGERLRTGKIHLEDITDKLDNKEFSLIQINDTKGETFRLTDNIVERIFENYSSVRKSEESGIFLIPRNISK